MFLKKMYKNRTVTQTGFTLIELSVVLVVIGLIVATITIGSGMIHSAQLRSVISDINKYKAAVNLFKDKYNALPGDMRDAYDYWGDDCFHVVDECNGDGNGQLAASNSDEVLQFWRQLKLDNFIEGKFTGAPANPPAPGYASIGVNIPAGPIAGTAFKAGYGCWSVGWTCFGKIGNLIFFGTVPDGHNYLTGGALSPADARSIDKKMDDGVADGGYVRPMNSYLPDGSSFDLRCTGVNPIFASSGSYDLSISDPVCRMAFFLD